MKLNREAKRNMKKDIKLFDNIIVIINKYFPELLNKFNGLTDLRHKSYIKYEMKVIFMVRLLGLICSIKSMNGLSNELNTEEAIANIAKICNLELRELPHYDTINDVFKNVQIEELEKINIYIIKQLIRCKMLDKYRIRNRYFHVVVDATGLATSRIKYNENCLIKKKEDKNGNKYLEYSTYVLEAKLVVGNMVFSIGNEFVENKEDIEKMNKEENEKSKQD